MKKKVQNIFNRLIENYPSLWDSRKDIEAVLNILANCYSIGGKALLCGNGGSAADCEHIVGELMKGFVLKRNVSDKQKMELETLFPGEGRYLSENLQGALPAISLVSHIALSSAYINDKKPDMVFAQQVFGYGKPGDVLVGLSTSGNSTNVLNAIRVAKYMDLKTIGLTGHVGGGMKKLCDAVICVPETEVYKVQELHLPVYHAICEMLEQEFFAREV